jgi:amidase
MGALVEDLCANDAVTLAGMMRRRDVSAREVIAAHIARIEALDGAINAVVTRSFDTALAKAAAADAALARGESTGLLHGLPVAHKDLFDTAGVRTTYGSPLSAENVPSRDALVVQRMSAAGAISLGKTNVPELGAGSHTVNPVFGATRPASATWSGCARRPAASPTGHSLTWPTCSASPGRWRARSPTSRCC